MEQGSYRKAHTSYGRAVTKVPGSVQYLDKFREALLAITPENREEARKLYNEYLQVLLDLGLVGAGLAGALFSLVLVAAFRGARRGGLELGLFGAVGEIGVDNVRVQRIDR